MFIVIARSFNHIGAGQKSSFAFSDWCRQIALAEAGKQKNGLEVGNLSVRRDFLHVEDVVRAYALLLEKGESGKIYNICSGRPLTLKKYLEFLLKKSKIYMDVKIRKDRLRNYDPQSITGSAQRIKTLGWKPERTVFEALEEMLEDWRKKAAA